MSFSEISAALDKSLALLHSIQKHYATASTSAGQSVEELAFAKQIELISHTISSARYSLHDLAHSQA